MLYVFYSGLCASYNFYLGVCQCAIRIFGQFLAILCYRFPAVRESLRRGVDLYWCVMLADSLDAGCGFDRCVVLMCVGVRHVRMCADVWLCQHVWMCSDVWMCRDGRMHESYIYEYGMTWECVWWSWHHGVMSTLHSWILRTYECVMTCMKWKSHGLSMNVSWRKRCINVS